MDEMTKAGLGCIGVTLPGIPERMTESVVGACVAVIVVGSFLGVIPVFRAHRT